MQDKIAYPPQVVNLLYQACKSAPLKQSMTRNSQPRGIDFINLDSALESPCYRGIRDGGTVNPRFTVLLTNHIIKQRSEDNVSNMYL